MPGTARSRIAAMMREYRGQVVHVYRPPARVKRLLGGESMTLPPKPAKISVRLDYGETLRGLPEPADERLVRGDRVTLHADLTPGGIIGPLQKDDN